MMRHAFSLVLVTSLCGVARTMHAQDLLRGGLLRENARYHVEVQGQSGTPRAALYTHANRYGLASTQGHAGYLRAGITRDVQEDSARHWRMGYGIDVAGLLKHTSSMAIHQAYVDVEYDWARLTIGAKAQPIHLKHEALSSGSFTLGKNSRPVPEVRLEIPHYLALDKGGWVSIKGHIAYGLSTDGAFQERYVREGQQYTRGTRIHTKSGFMRLGNETKFPLTLEGGLEMAGQYGGTAYNVNYAGYKDVVLSNGVKAMWHAFLPGGSDVTDEGYDNAVGNTLGSWLLAINYKGKDWRVRAYYDHFFEDHSQLFMQYNWRDGLWGVEVVLPRNPIAHTVVYEYMNTMHQSGALYHDHTPTIPDQVSGRDNYYGHGIYGSWSHWGQYIGHPLFITPLYRKDGSLSVSNNRFRAHHIGVSGQPHASLGYRVLATFTQNRGTYNALYPQQRQGQHYLVEANYTPQYIGRTYVDGWRATLGLALDRGAHLGRNTSVMLTISRSGDLFK